MSLEEMLDVWKEVRAGLIAELAQIPAEQFGFQATPESRSVAGVIRRGQICLYERLMRIEPALTAKLRESLVANG